MSNVSPEGVLAAQYNAALEAMQPSVLYRPHLSADGDKWCALYGDDLASGVAGFGDTPEQAMRAFDEAWRNERTPQATRNLLK